MKNFDLATNAKIAAERKRISVEQATKDLENIKANSKSDWGFGLGVKNYLESPRSERSGSPHGVDPIEPHHHTKE